MPASCSFSDTQAFGPASFGELVLPCEATDVLELQMNWVMVTKGGFPGGSDGKESACNARDSDLIPVSERSPGEGNGYPLQYSCLENSVVSGAWRVTVHGVAMSDTIERLTFTLTQRGSRPLGDPEVVCVPSGLFHSKAMFMSKFPPTPFKKVTSFVLFLWSGM